MTDGPAPQGPLAGLRVLDLTRILAGPTATQLLGDLGAEVIKIERPGAGDDTRGWGPPFLRDAEGAETRESAYYLSANRNKKSVAVDIAHPEGQALIRALAARSDVLVENFKRGDLARRGLDFPALDALNPRLVYCSITGFGQTGPLADLAGYDFMIQAMGGIMSLTGAADDRGGGPTKVGVAIADVMCGMYATVGILAALEARRTTGRGQMIDLALFDTQIAWLINQGTAYLMSGAVPGRRGNDHPAIVPYGSFPAADGDFVVAVGNDAQFRRFCALLDAPELGADPRFAANADRVRNRAALIPLLRARTVTRSVAEWLILMEARGVPGGPINDLAAVFAHPQARHREMSVEMRHAAAGDGAVSLIGNPLRLSRTPVRYRHPPPMLGEHTEAVLREVLDFDAERVEALKRAGAIAGPPDA